MDASDDVSGPAVGLVVGAGGPTGSTFIYAALEVLQAKTGWDPSTATTIVGTSAGAFVAARIRPPEPNVDELAQSQALEQLSAISNLDSLRATPFTVAIRGLRLFGGRVVALLAPPERDQALYDVPEGPYHPGASVVTIEHTWGVRHQHNLSQNADQAADMVRASAAIPYKNGPIKINGRLHADGAVHSANNVDLLDPRALPTIVVVSPMIPATGGSTVSNFHRSQLLEELRPWHLHDRKAVVIMPSEDEHANRRDRDAFREAGTRAAERLFA